MAWNILLKNSIDKILFTRSFTLIGSIILLPLLFFIEPLPHSAYPYLFLTLFIHVFYKFFLCKTYDNSGLSYGYPIARGSPSLIILFLTPYFLDQELDIQNKFSIIVLCAGILLLIFSEGKFKKINFKGLSYSLLVALTITLYTIVDSLGARASNVVSYLFTYFILDGFAFNLMSFVFLKKSYLTFNFIKNHFNTIFFASILSIYSYFPAVYGFSVSNVASVAALREVSILFASVYGVFFLKEKMGLVGFFSSLLIFAGAFLIKVYG